MLHGQDRSPRYVDETEIRVALHWKEEEDVRVAKIARRLGRIWSSFCGFCGVFRR